MVCVFGFVVFDGTDDDTDDDNIPAVDAATAANVPRFVVVVRRSGRVVVVVVVVVLRDDTLAFVVAFVLVVVVSCSAFWNFCRFCFRRCRGFKRRSVEMMPRVSNSWTDVTNWGRRR